MTMKATKTGKKLECRVEDAYRQMGASVQRDVRLAGNQIDIYVELETPDRGLHRIAVEAKDWTSKAVGIDIVNSFVIRVILLRDRRLIDEGILVSTSGFSKSARDAANEHGIRLLKPDDLDIMVAEAKARSKLQATHTLPVLPYPKTWHLYLAVAGSPHGTVEEYYVLGGVAVTEPRRRSLILRLTEIERAYLPGRSEPVEFQASTIRAGKKVWRKIPPSERQNVMDEVYSLMAQKGLPGSLVAFAAALHKPSLQNDEQPLYRAFAEVCGCFDIFLGRRHLHDEDIPQRGLVIWDDRGRILKDQPRWDMFRNLAESPFAADSRRTRMLQLATFCSYAVYRFYVFNDSIYLNRIIDLFAREDATIHGLVHFTADYRDCQCPVCVSRRG